MTELPGARASRQQLARLRHRYRLAARYAAGRDVLEVGCGAGLGLGWLGREGRCVVGGDCSASNLAAARRHYGGRVPLARLDAASLPFCDASFDLVVLFEALYYLPRPDGFVAECARVLRPGGAILIGTVNPEWRGFHPSPFAGRYFSAGDLQRLLGAGGFSAEIAGAFADGARSARAMAISGLKRAASRAGLIPKTMRGKEPLKRVFFGKLQRLPAELTPDGGGSMAVEVEAPVAVDTAAPSRDFSVVYAFGYLRERR